MPHMPLSCHVEEGMANLALLGHEDQGQNQTPFTPTNIRTHLLQSCAHQNYHSLDCSLGFFFSLSFGRGGGLLAVVGSGHLWLGLPPEAGMKAHSEGSKSHV